MANRRSILLGAHRPAPIPVNASGYLSNVVAPYAAYGAQRVVSGYSGNLFQLRRASDDATLDVAPYSTGDFPDYTAISTWAGGAALFVTTLYDQSGNGRNLTQATKANQPSFDVTQRTGNCVPILFDGYARSTGTGLPAILAKTLSMTASLDIISNSGFFAVAPICSFNQCGIADYTDDPATATTQGWFAGSEVLSLRTTGTTESSTFANNGSVLPRAQLDVIGFSNAAAASVIWGNGAKRSTGHSKTTTAIARFTLGNSIVGGASYNGTYKFFGGAIYNSTVSNTNGDTINGSLQTAFGYNSTFPYRAVFDGDSIMEGSGALLLKNMVNQLGLTKNAEVFNTGVHGQTLATIQAAQAARFANLYSASLPCVQFVQAGTNDLFTSGTTGSALYTTATNLITYLKGLGFKVVHCTILPRDNSTGWTSGKEAERVAYNALVVANSAGADLVLDLASDPVMAAVGAPANTTLYCDKLHPTTLGQYYLAQRYYAALQAILRTTALGGSYVP